MKKLNKFVFTVLSVVAFMTVSCKNNLGELGTVKGDGITAGKKVEISITTSKEYTLFPQDKSVAKTIVSPGYTNAGLDFYLFGENKTTNQSLEPQIVYFAPADLTGRKGTTNLDIGSYVWELTLVATDKNDPAPIAADNTVPSKEDLEAKAVLKGEAKADLRGTSSTIDFVLTPDNLAKTGQVNMKIFTDNWTIPDEYNVSFGLYSLGSPETELYQIPDPRPTDKATTENLTATNVDETKKTSAIKKIENKATASSTATYTYTANGASIKGATYKFLITFTAPSGKEYFYSEDIIILPGKGNTETVFIPDNIELPPQAPTDFKVGYIEPTETDTKTSFYSAVFEWTRVGKTEKYYELEIADLGVPTVATNTYSFITNAANETTDDNTWSTQNAYSTLTTTTTYDENFYKNNSVWVAGSLQKASTSATMKLILGNRYNARIRAVNDAGTSEWVYVVPGDTAEANAYTSTTMNLYRITYETTGCTWNPAQTTVSYHCETPAGEDGTGGVTIHNPTEGKLKKGDANWTNWKGYNAVGENPKKYTGFENLTLIPVFAKAANINIYNDADYVIPEGNIAITGQTCNNGVYTIDINNISQNPATGERNITWSITYPGNIVYDSVYLTLAKTTSLDNYVYNKNIDKTTRQFTMDVADLTGKYAAVLHYSVNGKKYTTQVTLNIEE